MATNKRRIAVNGFGRIGRTLTKLLTEDARFELVALNDISDVHTMAHLYKYDSVHGKNHQAVSHDTDHLIINGIGIPFLRYANPEQLPWAAYSPDIVVECSGMFKTQETLKAHLNQGAGKVLLSVPPEDDKIKTIVPGVNDQLLLDDDMIISNASCTTNNAAPMIKVLDELCGIESCYITTVHSYTGDQRLHDAPHKDLRRSRAAAVSIIPTTTGAAKALTRVFPHLTEHMGGCGMRVPVPDGSLTDITCTVKKAVTIEQVNEAFHQAAAGSLQGILEYTNDPIVSVDVINNPHSCVFDSQLTSVIGNMVKVVGWYDNEFGYSNRLIDTLLRMTR
ncbi:MAG: type I glyceraldehyde-3-phosphate dehydrogenase [Flavobacteriales bacterium]|nr:type I glyceraldehyde-3-phosphate dehydrogenase [Flavobacteriales bacterium]